MLEYIKLQNVGPASEMEMSPAQRLNLITGDNGLGKSFLLDVAWWGLTRTWARNLVVPHLPPAIPQMYFRFTKATPGTYEFMSKFDRSTDTWQLIKGRPPIPGLVLYAQVDGGFSVWDPARNYWKKDAPGRPTSFLFTPQEVWDGNEHCEGLIRDWGSWQREGNDSFAQLKRVLDVLSPSPSEPIEPGELRKITLDDPKRYPTLKMPYGMEVPVTQASAGMRRIIAMGYLLVWAWQEHIAACTLRGDDPTRNVIFLFDEIEAHLHPQWQRRIVPAILEVMDALTKNHESTTQLISVTHSPLILASVEPHFDEETDGVFHLKMEDHKVILEEEPWAKQGDVINWLVSDTFGLRQAQSLEAERAIEAAEAWMRRDSDSLPDGLRTEDEINNELRRVLPGHDPFWPRWVVWVREQRAGK